MGIRVPRQLSSVAHPDPAESVKLKNLSDPLDDDELDRLDEFLLNRLDDETSDAIAAADGDEGILNVAELDGFLTAIVSAPGTLVPSKWLPAMWGVQEPVWETMEQFQEIFGLIVRHQNSIASTLLHDPDGFEPLFGERETGGKTYLIVDEWCHGYMRGVALDSYAWSAGELKVQKLLAPIQLWGTEEGWRKVDGMSDADQAREQHTIPHSVREIYAYWL